MAELHQDLRSPAGARRALGNITVSKKLSGGFLLIVLLMLLVVGFTLNSIFNVLARVRALSQQHLPAAQLATRIDGITNQVALDIRGYALSDNQQYLAAGRAGLADLKTAIGDATALSHKYPNLTTLGTAVDALTRLVGDYETNIDQTVELRTARTALIGALATQGQAGRDSGERYLAEASQLAGGADRAMQAHPAQVRLINEVLNGSEHAANVAWNGLTTKDAAKLEEARGALPALAAKLDQLRESGGSPTSLDQLAAAKAALDQQARAISDLIANSQSQDAVDAKRGEVRSALLAQSQELAGKSIEAIIASSAETLSLLVTTQRIVIVATLLALLVSVAAAYLLSRDIISALNSVTSVADAIAAGNLHNTIATDSKDELGRLAGAVSGMQTNLRNARDESEARDWLKTGLSRLSESLLGELGEQEIADRVVSEVCQYLGASVGAFYVAEAQAEQPALTLLGSYAYTRRKNLSNQFGLGQGLVGQAALERTQILVSNVPEDYIKVVSGLGEAVPRNIAVTPLIFNNELKGVLELGALVPFTEPQLEYIAQAMPTVAITLETAQARERVRLALEESQRLTVELQAQQAELQAANEELQTQQEELSSANEELEAQTRQLLESEERLRAQQEELRVTNEELEERNHLLDRQRREVETARSEITQKAEELAVASKYKSEFLANMSHELRTPLNSLLLLARRFTDNKDGNLTAEQMESAGVIYDSGNDLLRLINEILDLSKIEAGRMELNIEAVRLADLVRSLRLGFAHLAQDKGLVLEVALDEAAPAEIASDYKRLEQVLRNLLSNALKFTASGGITVSFGPADPAANLSRSGLDPARALAIAVRDTGIGISPEEQKKVFEAFQQADGSISRKYGGTGLGLSISREIVRLLQGEIQLASTPGEGSTFTVFLPLKTVVPVEEGVEGEPGPAKVAAAPPGQSMPLQTQTRPTVPDDRAKLADGARAVLIVEDDPRFAELLVAQCHSRSLLCLTCASGEEALLLAERYKPQGIILDINLPGMDGWQVLERLKAASRTRHIPIHVISGVELSGDALRRGAIGQLRKPVTQEDIDAALGQIEDAASSRVRRVLVVEDDAVIRRDIVELLADETVDVVEASGAEAATQALRNEAFDCMILDLTLPDATGGELLAQLARQPEVKVPPVIIYTARDLTSAEEQELRQHSETIIVKGVRSQERLLDEVSLFLHQVVSAMPERKRQVILDLHDSDAALRGKNVLVVDDDMRTVFAVSKLLADHGMLPHKAENGERALALLGELPQVDIVLTDIMMPVLDGLETIKRIRSQPRFNRLPVIALTAKAMKGDQERCLAAGASDYLPKPVDPERLLSMLRVWLHR